MLCLRDITITHYSYKFYITHFPVKSDEFKYSSISVFSSCNVILGKLYNLHTTQVLFINIGEKTLAGLDKV